MLETVKITKLVHGGQGLGILSDGRKVFVWNALPGELVKIQITKKRKDYCEAISQEIIEASSERIKPLDEAFMSTSPWQVMSYEAENKYKQQVLTETMSREKVDWKKEINLYSDDRQWHYRNKMEYSFWADDNGLHLALFHRGSHGKQIVPGSSIARPEIDAAAHEALDVLVANGVRGSQLKTLILRCNQEGDVVMALFVKDEKFPKIQGLKSIAQGITVCYSTPKSPASVITKKLYTYGDTSMTDMIMGVNINYDVHSFFQVNVPVFENALKRIDHFTAGADNKIDLYCGVGTIGVAIGNTKKFIEIDKINCEYARINAGSDAKIIQASSEQALDHIDPDSTLIVDPPRAGLHAKLIDRILEAKPKMVAYLSCNPSTQARDIALLQLGYKLKTIEGYNFFPRTPHIESLAVMIKK